MHSYTVPSKYKHQTRLGNWSEEWELEQTRMKDYLKAKENVQLQTVSKERKLELSLQKASLTYSQSGIVNFGDHLMLANEKTQGYLACNINEKYGNLEESYTVTTSKTVQPCSRSVFIIEKYEKEPDLFQGNELHFGQKFRIRINPRLINKPLYLASFPPSPQKCAKFSRQQLVLVSNCDNINSVWVAETSSPQVRFESKGKSVTVNSSILLKHVLTQQWLGSDEINYQNIFGTEFEVYGHSHQSHNKTQNLIAEKCGRTTVDIPMRNQNAQNSWSFVSAADQSLEFDESVLDQSVTADGLINKIRHLLIQKGEYGFRGLLKAFQNMDRDNNGNLDCDDFKWGLRNYGLQFNEHEFRLLQEAFDKNKDNSIDFSEFSSTLRGMQSPQRSDLIQGIYTHIQQRLGGVVTYVEFIKLFNAAKHPDVVKTFQTERQVFQDFVNAFGQREPTQEVTLEEFYSFYSDISSSLDRDDIFQAVISNVWEYAK